MQECTLLSRSPSVCSRKQVPSQAGWNHRIPEWFGLEENLMMTELQPHCHGQGNLHWTKLLRALSPWGCRATTSPSPGWYSLASCEFWGFSWRMVSYLPSPVDKWRLHIATGFTPLFLLFFRGETSHLWRKPCFSSCLHFTSITCFLQRCLYLCRHAFSRFACPLFLRAPTEPLPESK